MAAPNASERRLQEASSMLMLWSFFALVEGTIRMTSNSKPSPDVDYFDTADGTKIPVFVFLLGGAAEVLFGMLGFFVGFHSQLFGQNKPLLTKLFLFVQAVLGWFVFLTYVVAAPIKTAMSASGNAILSANQQRSIIILGNMLGSITFCYALQGGQFIMGLRLLAAQTGQPESRSKNKLRAYIWLVNLLVAAASTLYVGIVLYSKDFTSTTAPIGAPPHVVWFPIMSIITGVIMAVFGIVSFFGVFRYEMVQNLMPAMWIVTTVAMMANFSWSFGIVPGLAPPIPGSAQHLGLVLSVTILPMYHTYRTHYLVDDDVDGSGKSMATDDDDKSPHDIEAYDHNDLSSELDA